MAATAAASSRCPVVAGCEARVYGTTPAPPAGPQLTVVAPQGSLAPLPEAPPDEPAATFDGLDGRARQATADAAKAGADITAVVLDRNTGQTRLQRRQQPFADRVGGEAVHRRRPAAAGVQGPDRAVARRPQVTRRHAAVLRRQRGRECSGTAAAAALIITRVVARYGLTGTTTPNNGRWYNTLSTASDLVRYYDMLLDGSGGLPPEQANIILSNLGAVNADRYRRLPATLRHSRGALRRTGCRQTGLDVLLERRRLDAPVHRRDRTRPPLRHGDQFTAARRRGGRADRPSPRPSRRCSPAGRSSFAWSGRSSQSDQVEGYAAVSASSMKLSSAQSNCLQAMASALRRTNSGGRRGSSAARPGARTRP